jgi:putative membrane protein
MHKLKKGRTFFVRSVTRIFGGFMVKRILAIGVSILLLVFITPVLAQYDKPATKPEPKQNEMKSDMRAEGEIIAFLLAVDQHEVAAGKMANQKSTNANVKQYAETMIRDHTKHLEDTQKLMNNINVQPREAPDIDQTKAEAEAARKKLTSMQGAAFDSAYIDQMVKDHATALDHIDNHYLKATENAQLLNLLRETRTAVAKHHEEAERIQGMLNK